MSLSPLLSTCKTPHDWLRDRAIIAGLLGRIGERHHPQVGDRPR